MDAANDTWRGSEASSERIIRVGHFPPPLHTQDSRDRSTEAPLRLVSTPGGEHKREKKKLLSEIPSSSLALVVSPPHELRLLPVSPLSPVPEVCPLPLVPDFC